MNTNTWYPKKERLESIWGITPEIVLKQAFWIIHEDEIAWFYGKTLLDVGAGFSDLLHHISEHSDPTRMIAVDPIYGWQEADATIFTLNSIQKFIDLILSDPDCSTDECLIGMKQNAERQKEVILNYHYQTIAIERRQDIPVGIGADYAFAINVLYAAKNPKNILERMDQELDKDGEIVIIDYVGRGNNIGAKLTKANIEIKKFDQYFISRLKKWDTSKINWNI